MKMNDADYRMAVMLQHEFEREVAKDHKSLHDLQYAHLLQEQFQQEINTEKPLNGLVYDSKSKKSKSTDSTKSLVDPSWEVIDPTPDIHVLFVTFNEKFFWNKLVTVCVSWSKRMTTCAGICSYQGRGGMCSITLSEPLLKLRPRKDLVETLLHEMIHAYLFVTHNNKDRDGHGPEFHKHMYRINADAGTNITVYHNFHDEVRLYKQHWWRCDGPCQKQKPYFGMVRRATNRAPGPNDFWWAEHARRCGGNFIKVKEPEKKTKKKDEKENKPKQPSSKNDIRNYGSVLQNNNKTTNTTAKIASSSSTSTSKSVNNTTNTPKNLNNVISFEEWERRNKVKTPNAVKNSSSTIVVTNSRVKSSQNSTELDKPKPVFHGSAQPLGGTLVAINNYEAIRNHWINKFSNCETNKATCSELTNAPNKRTFSESSATTHKRVRFSSEIDVKVIDNSPLKKITNDSNNIPPKDNTESVVCPVCQKMFPTAIINEHLDKCLLKEEQEKELDEECFNCFKMISKSNFAVHVLGCIDKYPGDELHCDHCMKMIKKTAMKLHLNTCVTVKNTQTKKCLACDTNIASEKYDSHATKCLQKFYDDIENKYVKQEELTSCTVCGEKVQKGLLNEHMKDCVDSVFIDDTDFSAANEDKNNDSALHTFESSWTNTTDEKRYNCPFCMQLFYEKDMNDHLDICLNTEPSEDNADKSLIRNVLSENEF